MVEFAYSRISQHMSILPILSASIMYGFIFFNFFIVSAYLALDGYRNSYIRLISISGIFLVIGSLLFLTSSILEIISYSNSQEVWQKYILTNRLFGPYWLTYWSTILFKGLIPQVLWIKNLRRKIWVSLALVPFLLVDIYAQLLFPNHEDSAASFWRIASSFDFPILLIQVSGYGLILALAFILTTRMDANGLGMGRRTKKTN